MANGHLLYFDAESPLHRAPAAAKVLALVAFMIGVVAVPAAWWPVFAGCALFVLGVALVARIPLTFLVPRMLIETPVVVFAVVTPFLAHGERIELWGISVSRPGLIAAGEILVTATLGVFCALLLAASTTVPDLLKGLRTLRLPAQFVDIMGFMLRYLEVVTGDVQRTLIAMRARGAEPTSPKQWPAVARVMATIFIRSYERGERVHLAMLSRGYQGGS